MLYTNSSLTFKVTDLLTVWLTDWLTDGSTDRPTDRWTDPWTDRWTDGQTNQSTDQPTDRPTNRPTHQPTDPPTHRTTDQPTHRPTDWTTKRLTDRRTDWLTDWLTQSINQSINHSLSESLTHSLTQSSLIHSLTRSPTHSLTQSLTHSLTLEWIIKVYWAFMWGGFCWNKVNFLNLFNMLFVKLWLLKSVGKILVIFKVAFRQMNLLEKIACLFQNTGRFFLSYCLGYGFNCTTSQYILGVRKSTPVRSKECLSYEDTCMAVRVSFLAEGRTISYIHGLCAWSETDTCSTLCSSRRRDDPTITSCKVSIKNKNFWRIWLIITEKYCKYHFTTRYIIFILILYAYVFVYISFTLVSV